MARRFTDISIKNVKARVARREIPDPGARGLYLIIQPSGVKSFACRYRFGGKAYKLTLGPVDIGLAVARQMTATALAEVAQGRNPVDAKKASQRAARAQQEADRNTLRAVCERYLSDPNVASKKRAGEKADILHRLVYPVLGDLPIESIKRSTVVALLDRITAGEFARNKKPTPIMSNRARAAIGTVFRWYANRSDDFRSPIAGMQSLNEEHARERTLSDDEIRQIWAACEAAPTNFNRLVQFLLVTGARRTEGSALPWEEVNGAWTLPPARNKAGFELVRPLNKHARAIIDSMVRRCDYVFPARTDAPINSHGYYKRQLDSACGVQNWTLHDLRRTARTLMSRARIDPDTCERMLGHKIGGVREVYDRHGYLVEMTRGFDALSVLLDQILDPKDNVVQIRSKA